LVEVEKNNWAQNFKNLLKEALSLKQTCLDNDKAFSPNDYQMQDIEHKLNKLLTFPILKEHSPLTRTFQNQMVKNRNYLFTFLYNLDVPPDNNASERAVRNVKVKQKISGQFKSGHDTFCVMRSVIDTLRKRELDVLQNLNRIMAI
jgi:hypothetical protein